jgi:MraZ protein
VFRGHFRHTIDPKGRVSIPAKFRDLLGESQDAELVVVPTANALVVHPISEFKNLEARVKALPSQSPLRRDFLYSYISRGLDVELDRNGRIQVPQDYRERAGLKRDVVIIGMMESFEVWDLERYTHFERETITPLDELRQKLGELGV